VLHSISNTKLEGHMAEPEQKHPLQKLLDNPWALLALGVLLPIISYTVWGLVELQNLKPALLP